MEKPRIVFFGTPEFACVILQTLIDEKQNVVAVVSQPDRPVGRKHIIQPTPVHALANQYGIPTVAPEKLSADIDCVLQYKPDLIITCAYGQFVPTSILNVPRLGCLNIHPSLLPKYRGGAPIHHAIMHGDNETGVSLMEMTKAMDAGKVYAQTHLSIGEDETMEELNIRLEESSKDLIRDFLPKYIAGELPGIEQDPNLVTFGYNITKEEEKVSFQTEELPSLYNHIRGLINWPVAYGLVDGKRMKFLKVRKEELNSSKQPGTILGFEEDYMQIACIGGILKVYELQPEGKGKMDAKAYANGAGRNMIGKIFD